MNVHAADQLDQVISTTGSVACIGLDPRPQLLPPELIAAAVAKHGHSAEAVAAAFLAFNTGIIEVCAGRCAALKPQAACYEAYGHAGWACLEATVKLGRDAGIPVIIDAKRGDIGSTAEHYRQAFFGGAPGLNGTALPGMGGNWLTVNGYLGSDGITPFLGQDHGIFVLVKTSNPSSGDLQDRPIADGSSVADRMADLVASWGQTRRGASGLSDVGAVVGATWPDQARQLRQRMPDSIFLIPGYGAQGGSAKDALAGARPDGRGVIINSSRGIIGAWQKSTAPWKDAIHQAVSAMNADLSTARSA
jgi:orotidine-5'-phosphate decarboxylase